jgi:hypothetical protein
MFRLKIGICPIRASELTEAVNAIATNPKQVKLTRELTFIAKAM